MLKPCPFCGGRPSRRDGLSIHWLVCDGCGIQTADHPAYGAAVAIWNGRAGDPSDEVEEVEDDWLLSIGFKDYSGAWDRILCSGELECKGSFRSRVREWRFNNALIPTPRSRGDVRRLMSCLGIELKPTAQPPLAK